MYMELDLTLI